MLVLLSFALVLAATVLLVLGLLNDDGLTLIYLSIACSVAAAVVLIVALRRNKPRADAKTAPAPLPVSDEPAAAPVAPVAAAAPVAASGGEWLASDFEEVQEEVDFPIADYDDLTAGQILPLLPQLYADEINVVDARERATKARPEILDRLAELRGDEPVTAVPAGAAPAWADDDDWFPIEDYESLSAAQIRPLLGELDAEELSLVRDREMALGRRRSLLDDIDRRLGAPTVAVPAVAAAAAPAAKVPAAKVPAAKVPAAKAPAKKAAPVKKAAAPAKKAPAAKTPAKKAAAPTKKAAAPAKKAPAAKTPAKKAAAPAKKAAAPAKKAPAPAKKAAAPAKKAATPATKAAAPAKKATKKS